MKRVLGIVGPRVARASALLLTVLACTDSTIKPVAPNGQTGRLGMSLSAGSSFDVVVNSDIELRDAEGKLKRWKHRTKVRARVDDAGNARSVRGVAAAPSVSNGSSSVEDLRLSYQYEGTVPDSIVMTPVLGLASGELVGAVDEIGYDDQGNEVRTITSGSYGGNPMTDAATYVNGALTATVRWNWQQVSGGYALTSQTLTGYSNGQVMNQIISTVDQDTYQIVSIPSRGDRLADAALNAVNRAFCVFAPAVAYAQPRCAWEVAMFAGNTTAIGIAIAVPWTRPIAELAAHLIGWVSWTESLYNMLRCIRPPRVR